jgi:hypothetical protein
MGLIALIGFVLLTVWVPPRRVVVASVRDGGFPPVMLDPVNFAGLIGIPGTSGTLNAAVRRTDRVGGVLSDPLDRRVA